jgi:wyosine [tRNA(Phe)-imidazoG37] synthetase (radical SAM superfamily)
MATFLFDSIIFGPVWSRRLGESLGINLLPVNRKVCNFNCVYCECGLTPSGNPDVNFPNADEVKNLLSFRLQEMKKNGEYLDSITFAGNGEPTLHPEFTRIMDDTIEKRDLLFPKANITVLSNATLIGEKKIFTALLKADLNILKLDSAIEETLHNINCPKGNYNLADILHSMKLFKGKMIIQTLFFRGSLNGRTVDNTTETEITAWLSVLGQLHPGCVMIYSIARDTAVQGLESISPGELETIARRVEQIGIKTQVTP